MTDSPIQVGSAPASPSVTWGGAGSSPSASIKGLEGTTLSGVTVVSESSNASSSQVLTKGVIVKETFIPVKLPDWISVGDRVDLKQVEVAGEATLVFISLSNGATDQASSRETSLKKLLGALKINDQSINALRQLLGVAQTSTNFGEESQLILSDSLVTLLESSGITQSYGNQPSKLVRAALLSPAKRILVDLLSCVIKSREENTTDSATNNLIDKARLVLRELRALGITQGATTNTVIPLKLGHQLFPELNPKLLVLLEKLAHIKDNSDPSIRELLASFKQLISAQLERIPTLELRVKSLLIDSISSGGSLGALVKLLQQLAPTTAEAESQLQVFVKKLLENIEQVVKKEGGVDLLRQVLKEGLRDLYQDFDLVPLETLGQNPLQEQNQSRPAYKGSLRLIETQLFFLIASPDLDRELESLIAGDRSQAPKLQELHNSLNSVLNNKDIELPDQLRSNIENVISRLDTVFKEGKKSPESIRQILQTLTNAVSVELVRDEFPLTQDQPLAQIMKAISYVLEEFDQEPSRLTSGQPHRLKELLKSVTLELPLSADAQTNELLSESYRVINQLDRLSEKDAIFPSLKHQLQGLLTRYQQLAEGASSSFEIESGLQLVDQEALKQITTMIASQDVLQRLAPMAKSLGEPVFMLFPLLLGNILSHAQVTLRNGFSLGGEQDEGQERGAPECFQRIQITVTLPALGQVMVELAYRKGELLLNIFTTSVATMQIIERRLPQLRKVFAALGYSKNQIYVARESVKPRDKMVVSDAQENGLLARCARFQNVG